MFISYIRLWFWLFHGGKAPIDFFSKFQFLLFAQWLPFSHRVSDCQRRYAQIERADGDSIWLREIPPICVWKRNHNWKRPQTVRKHFQKAITSSSDETSNNASTSAEVQSQCSVQTWQIIIYCWCSESCLSDRRERGSVGRSVGGELGGITTSHF